MENAYTKIGEAFRRGFITEKDFPMELLNKFLISKQRDREYLKRVLCTPTPELSDIVEQIFKEVKQ